MDKKRSTHQFWKLTGIFIETFIVNNIVLIQAIGICPIIAVGTNLKYGVALTLCTAAVLLPTSLFMSLYGDKLPAAARPRCIPWGVGPAGWGGLSVDRFISTELYASLYLFLPLMAVNTIFTYRAGGFSVSNRPAAALVDALGSVCGFGLVICAVSALRELAISGTLWDKPMGFDLRLPEAAQPFAAFILLGFMAAFLQWIKAGVSHFFQRKEEESR